MAELIELAEDRGKWRLEVNSLKFGSIADPETVQYQLLIVLLSVYRYLNAGSNARERTRYQES